MQILSKYSIIEPVKEMVLRYTGMPYISGFAPDQLMCCSGDTFVDKEIIARIIDVFLNSLGISSYGVKSESVENPQTAADSKTHLICAFQMTNQVTDHGLLEITMRVIKEAEPEAVVEVVTM